MPFRIRDTLGKISLVVFSLFISLVVAELGARIYFGSAEKFTPEMAANYFERRLNLPDFGGGNWLFSLQPHPFFGFVFDNFVVEGANNHGFEDPNPFPYQKKDPREFVIGVLGGSVAQQWTQWTTGDSAFVERLQALVPALKNRKIVILNMSIAGYKQPQQFYIASYFVESVDIFLSIEGFNEVNNSIPPAIYPEEFPTAGYLMFRHNERLSEARAKVGKWLSLYKKTMALTNRFPFLRKSLLVYSLSRWSDSRLDAETNELSKEGIAELGRDLQGKRAFWPRGNPGPAHSQQAALNIWKKYLKLQTAVAESAGKASFVFFQPNQYLKNSKPFSDTELRAAFTPGPLQEELNRLLSAWRKAIPGLQAAGVKVFDLSQTFAKVPETIYIDNCCHVNEHGQRILANAIAEQLAGPLSRMLGKRK